MALEDGTDELRKHVSDSYALAINIIADHRSAPQQRVFYVLRRCAAPTRQLQP